MQEQKTVFFGFSENKPDFQAKDVPIPVRAGQSAAITCINAGPGTQTQTQASIDVENGRLGALDAYIAAVHNHLLAPQDRPAAICHLDELSAMFSEL